MDQELVEIFTDEIGELKNELNPILESLKENNQQPKLFKDFSQVIDRIYGTATTMGFTEIGEYLGSVRNLNRKASSSNIPIGMQATFKISRTCMDHFDTIKESLTNTHAAKELTEIVKLENKKMEKIENEIFSFSKDASSSII
jgi:chemotaxis protein histidine kinase CheA